VAPEAQLAQPEAPAAEKVPAPHARHAEAPVHGWYEPAAHPVHPLDPATE